MLPSLIGITGVTQKPHKKNIAFVEYQFHQKAFSTFMPMHYMLLLPLLFIYSRYFMI